MDRDMISDLDLLLQKVNFVLLLQELLLLSCNLWKNSYQKCKLCIIILGIGA